MRGEFTSQKVHRVQSGSYGEGGFQIPLRQVWARLQAPVAVNVETFNTQACIYGRPTEMAIGTLKGPVQRTTIPIVVKETPTATWITQSGLPLACEMLPFPRLPPPHSFHYFYPHSRWCRWPRGGSVVGSAQNKGPTPSGPSLLRFRHGRTACAREPVCIHRASISVS